MFESRKSSYRRWRYPSWAVIIIFICCLVSCADDRPKGPLEPSTDLGPTAVISNLRVTAITADRITISWTAPPWKGEEIQYQIRHSEDSLTVANWSEGVECLYVPPVEDSGRTQSYDVAGLPAGKLSYIAIRACNTKNYLGPISKNISGILPSLLSTPLRHSYSGDVITALDFDSDGDMDIAIVRTGQFGDDLSILRNDGTGRFALNQSLSLNGSLSAIRAADFNNDGSKDIAVLSTSFVFVLINDGLGQVAVSDSINIGLMGGAMQVGDFDRDGFPDIVIGNTYSGGKFGGISRSLAIYFNDRTGGFGYADTVSTAYSISDICPFDADNDGDLDIASTYAGTETIQIFYNDGTGRKWNSQQSVGIGKYWPFVTHGDLNNDGKLDLIGVSWDGDLITSVLRENQGVYSVTRSTPGAGKGSEIRLGDFDGDGFLDIARAEYGTLTLHVNDRYGGFAGAATYSAGNEAYLSALEVADFNGDGHPDVAVIQNAGELIIYSSSL